MMETLESTETSHCDVIDLFPHPPVSPQTCGFWRGEWGPSSEQERGGSLPPAEALQILDWFVTPAPSDIHQSHHLGAPGQVLISPCPPSLPRCAAVSTPTSQMKTLRLRNTICPRSYIIWSQRWWLSAAPPPLERHFQGFVK